MFPIEIVSTPEERELVLDESWKQVGDELPQSMLPDEDELDEVDAEVVTTELFERVQQERRESRGLVEAGD